MKVKVNRAPIDQWIKDAYPNGLYKLSEACGIPVNSLSKIRLGVWVPKSPRARQSLAEALGLKESEVFPGQSGTTRAS